GEGGVFHGVEEDGISFELRQRERKLDLVQNRLDQLTDDDVAMLQRLLVGQHEVGVAADVGDQQKDFLFAQRHHRPPATTMSPFVEPTIVSNSVCSAFGTLNWSSTATKSRTIASHSFSVMCRWRCASFIDRPVYVCGPPVTWQTSAVTWNLRPAFGT